MKRLIILTAVTAVAVSARAQNTTYGGGSAPYVVDGGYVSDYSPGGTIVLADGSVTLSNSATYEHGNNLLQNGGNWTAASGSLDLFLSAGSNTISGSAAPSFFNVQFNNGAGNTMAITNTQGINVAGQAQLNNGITTTVRSNTAAGSLKFADNATYTGGTTDAQHVNGYVSKTGNDIFTFPVGSGTDVRTLAISAPATATDQYSVAWIAGNPGTNGDPSNANAMHPTTSVTTPVASVSTQGQWDWIPVSGTGAGLTITVSLPAGVNMATAASLRLVGWNGTSWIDLSGSATASGNTEGDALSGTMIAGITAIGIGSTSVVLPVTFGSFAVQEQGCEAVLSWTTQMEQNNDYFAIERSQDGRIFTVIDKVAAAGSSNTTQSYSYYDRLPANGMNYYRIMQVDVDGQHSSTAVKSLKFDCANGTIKVYPTVNQGTVYVALPAGYEQAKISVVDINGRPITADVTAGGLSRTVQLKSIAAGTYLLRVIHNSDVETFKILYQP
jgi:hypothetical protein